MLGTASAVASRRSRRETGLVAFLGTIRRPFPERPRPVRFLEPLPLLRQVGRQLCPRLHQVHRQDAVQGLPMVRIEAAAPDLLTLSLERVPVLFVLKLAFSGIVA